MDDNAEVWNTIIELGGGKGFARFGVISAASEVPLTYQSIIRCNLYLNCTVYLCMTP